MNKFFLEILEEDAPDFETLSVEEQNAIINGTHQTAQPEGSEDVEPDDADEGEDESAESLVDNEEPEKPSENESVKKPNSNVAKLLSGRTADRQRIAALTAEVAELKESSGQGDPEADDKYHDKRMDLKVAQAELDRAERAERESFFKANPKAEKDKEALETILSEYPTMSVNDAYALLLVKTNRVSELAPAITPKANKFGLTGKTASQATATQEETPEQYEARAKADQAKGKSTPFQGQKSR